MFSCSNFKKDVICVINLPIIIHREILSLTLMFMYYIPLIDRKSLPRSELQKGGALRCILKRFVAYRHSVKRAWFLPRLSNIAKKLIQFSYKPAQYIL